MNEPERPSISARTLPALAASWLKFTNLLPDLTFRTFIAEPPKNAQRPANKAPFTHFRDASTNVRAIVNASLFVKNHYFGTK
jgi:hypothetical protein